MAPYMSIGENESAGSFRLVWSCHGCQRDRISVLAGIGLAERFGSEVGDATMCGQDLPPRVTALPPCERVVVK